MIKILYVGVLTTLFVYAEINPFALDENMQKIEQAEASLLESLQSSTPKVSKKNTTREKRRKVEHAEAIRLKHQAALKRAKERRVAQLRHNKELKKAQLAKRKLQQAKALQEQKEKQKVHHTVKKQRIKKVKKKVLVKETVSKQAYLDAIKEVE